jgi:hypothetical protein
MRRYLRGLRGRRRDTHRTILVDEMTGIQALERIAPRLPMLPGKAEQREFKCRRHGAQILIAAFNVTAGKVEGVVRNSPIGKRFRPLSAQVVEHRPTARWNIVGDNLFICAS